MEEKRRVKEREREREGKKVKSIYELSPFSYLKPSEIVAQASNRIFIYTLAQCSFKFVGNPCSLFSNIN